MNELKFTCLSVLEVELNQSSDRPPHTLVVTGLNIDPVHMYTDIFECIFSVFDPLWFYIRPVLRDETERSCGLYIGIDDLSQCKTLVVVGEEVKV